MGLFYDFDNEDIGFSFSDTIGMNSKGDFIMKLDDTFSMNMDTGDIGLIAGWENEEGTEN